VPTSAQTQALLKIYAHGGNDNQVIAAIVNSPTYRQNALATGVGGNSAVVSSLYLSLLDRLPTNSELAQGVSLLNKGRQRYLTHTIMTSYEYLMDQVSIDYTLYMGRTATQTEVRHGISALRHGPNERLVARLMGSREYFRNHPGASGQR
jgi:hypothetical protein